MEETLWFCTAWSATKHYRFSSPFSPLWMWIIPPPPLHFKVNCHFLTVGLTSPTTKVWTVWFLGTRESVCTSSYIYGGQRSTCVCVCGGGVPYKLSLTGAWNLLISPGWLASEPSGPVCLCLLNTGWSDTVEKQMLIKYFIFSWPLNNFRLKNRNFSISVSEQSFLL